MTIKRTANDWLEDTIEQLITPQKETTLGTFENETAVYFLSKQTIARREFLDRLRKRVNEFLVQDCNNTDMSAMDSGELEKYLSKTIRTEIKNLKAIIKREGGK